MANVTSYFATGQLQMTASSYFGDIFSIPLIQSYIYIILLTMKFKFTVNNLNVNLTYKIRNVDLEVNKIIGRA